MAISKEGGKIQRFGWCSSRFVIEVIYHSVFLVDLLGEPPSVASALDSLAQQGRGECLSDGAMFHVLNKFIIR